MGGHELAQLDIHGQEVVDDVFRHPLRIETLDQYRLLRGDAYRAQAGVASVAAAVIVTETTGHLQNQFAGEYAVGAERHIILKASAARLPVLPRPPAAHSGI